MRRATPGGAGPGAAKPGGAKPDARELGKPPLSRALPPPWRYRLAQPVFLLGLPRSGTSMCAGALAACGLWLGETVGPAPENPKGFFENVALREGFNKKLLGHLRADPLGVDPLPDLGQVEALALHGLEDFVVQSLKHQAYGFDRPWGFKDAKLTLLWPIWLAAFPGARWLIVRRGAGDVVASCLRTRFMVQHSKDPAFWRAFIAAYNLRLDELKAATPHWRELEVEPVMAGDLAGLEAAVDWAGLPWDETAVTEFVDRRHWKRNDYRAVKD